MVFSTAYNQFIESMQKDKNVCLREIHGSRDFDNFIRLFTNEIIQEYQNAKSIAKDEFKRLECMKDWFTTVQEIIKANIYYNFYGVEGSAKKLISLLSQ